MRRPLDLMVHEVLAAHLEVPVAGIADHHELERDLGMSRLNLRLMLLDIEDIEGLDLSSQRSDGLKTVGDLVGFTREACRARYRPSPGVSCEARKAPPMLEMCAS